MFFSRATIFAGLVIVPLVLFIASSVSSFSVLDSLAVQENHLTTEVTHNAYSDKDGLNAERIFERTRRFDLTPVDKTKLGFSESGFWHVVSVKNLTNSRVRYRIVLDNPTIDYIRVYEVYDDDVKHVTSLGDQQPGISRAQLAAPVHLLEINKTSSQTVLFYTKTTGSYFLPIKVFEESSFIRYQNAVSMIWGAFIGVVLLMTVYNLILYVGGKERLYILYVGYILSFLIELGVVHGYNFYILPEATARVASQNIIVLNYLISYFTIRFAMEFFKIEKTINFRSYRVSRVLQILVLLGGLISIFIKEMYAAPLFFVIQIIMYVFVVSVIVKKWREGIKWAKYYVISWCPLLVGAGIGSLLFMGVVEYNFWTRHALLLSVMFEMAFISMALAERLRISEADRLYQASHDPVFGFPNISLMRNKVSSLAMEGRYNDFSVISVAVQKYESISPYLETDELKLLMHEVATDIERKLASELMLINLESDARANSTAMIREGVFAFIVTSNDRVLLEKVLNELASDQPKTYQLKSASLRLNCTIGAASLSDCEKGVEEIVNRSLQGVEIANQNKSNIWWFKTRSNDVAGSKLKIATALKNALLADELKLVYQPQVSLVDNKVIGLEVLLRWDNNLGLGSTDEFIAVAEDTGLIEKVSEWVFEKACLDLIRLREQCSFKGVLSINVSIYDINSGTFLSYLIQTLDKHQLKANDFILEVTENVGYEYNSKFLQRLKEFREFGFRIAIDNFGKGRSSLTYLSRMPFSQLKIDGSIISECLNDKTSQEILKASVNIAHSLKYKAIAQNVESEEVLIFLKEIGCDIGQGLYINKPMTIEEAKESLSSSITITTKTVG